MRAAQKLYEAGHITYMRTDSVNLGRKRSRRWRALLKKNLGKEYLRARAYKTTSKNAQEAHEAVRPTGFRAHTRVPRRTRYGTLRARPHPRARLADGSCANHAHECSRYG